MIQQEIKRAEIVSELNKTGRGTAENVAQALGIALKQAAWYAGLSENELQKLRDGRIDDFWNAGAYNIIYKMVDDRWKNYVIANYIKSLGIFVGSDSTLKQHIQIIKKHNFPELIQEEQKAREHNQMEKRLTKLGKLKISCILTKLEPTEWELKIRDQLIEKYPVCKEFHDIFNDFHQTIMGKDIKKLNWFLKKYKKRLPEFCNSLKKDRPSVEQAITSNISSGIVEGNNTKFKLVKRIVYGRSDLVNLSKKFLLYCRFEDGDYIIPDCSL